MKKIFIYLLLPVLIFSFFSINISNIEARSGCCSHHLGVKSNGCGCNDGTPLSATCAPYYSCTATTYQPEPITPHKEPIKPTLPIVVQPTVINTVKTQPTITTPTVKVTPKSLVKPTPEIKPIVEPIIEQDQKDNEVIPTPTTETKRPNFMKRFFNWLF